MGFRDLSKPGMNYWSATDEILAESGGNFPTCSVCHTEMYPIDDHGRFACACPSMGDIIRRVLREQKTKK
jgi:hypothetical protein